MTRFVVGDDRGQSTLFPERLDDYLGEDNPVRAIDVFVEELDLAGLGFDGVQPLATGRPAYHPATLLKIYVYGYLNRVQSSRRLDRFMAGVYFSTGLISLWAAITIRQQGTLVYLLALGVLLAGAGRLVSISRVGLPKPTWVWLGYLVPELLLPFVIAVAHYARF